MSGIEPDAGDQAVYLQAPSVEVCSYLGISLKRPSPTEQATTRVSLEAPVYFGGDKGIIHLTK
jgi:hypothetical protein